MKKVLSVLLVMVMILHLQLAETTKARLTVRFTKLVGMYR